jgi:hypothetical protein
LSLVPAVFSMGGTTWPHGIYGDSGDAFTGRRGILAFTSTL